MCLAFACLAACRTSAPVDPDTDRSVSTLDRLIKSGAPTAGDIDTARSCVQRARAEPDARSCRAQRPPRTIDLHLALDPRYISKWPGATQRMAKTLRCVNRLYAGTGLRFKIEKLTTYEPAEQRHDLYALLARLRRDLPADGKMLTMGISVWDERKIYGMSGGEIGLSQGAHCVVPSWPRPENDCLILAHELGHLTGAVHVPGKSWVMGWAARPFYLPSTDPLARVVATYRFHPRNVAALRAASRGRMTKHGLRLAPRCRRWLQRIDDCWRGKR